MHECVDPNGEFRWNSCDKKMRKKQHEWKLILKSRNCRKEFEWYLCLIKYCSKHLKQQLDLKIMSKVSTTRIREWPKHKNHKHEKNTRFEQKSWRQNKFMLHDDVEENAVYC